MIWCSGDGTLAGGVPSGVKTDDRAVLRRLGSDCSSKQSSDAAFPPAKRRMTLNGAVPSLHSIAGSSVTDIEKRGRVSVGPLARLCGGVVARGGMRCDGRNETTKGVSRLPPPSPSRSSADSRPPSRIADARAMCRRSVVCAFYHASDPNAVESSRVLSPKSLPAAYFARFAVNSKIFLLWRCCFRSRR